MAMGKFENKVVIVSGGAGGCGLSAAQLFAQEGAKIGVVSWIGI